MNSNTTDRALYGGGVSDPHLQILKSKCMNCHNYHSEWLNYTTDDDWLNYGLIIRGDAANSLLIQRTVNAGGNMPQGGSPLSPAEYQVLLDWINNIP